MTLLSNKGSGVRPLHITRWASRLLNYNFRMEYKKGVDNLVADALSRLPSPDTENGMFFEEDIVSLVIAPLSRTYFQTATANDPVLPGVIQYTMSTWPQDSASVPDLRPYYSVRNQLSVHNELLMQGKKIVVPQALRENIVDMAHETHQGIVRTASIIRDRYWWPRMDEQIKHKVQHCAVWNATDRPVRAAPAPLQPVQFPDQCM